MKLLESVATSNPSLELILISSVPMVVGISLLAKPIWSIFYGYNINGTIILSTHIFTSLFFNIYVVTSSTLQSLNKFKAVYISTLTGFIINALLDVPLMILFNAMGLKPYLGAILATCIGYFLSVFIALRILKKEHKLKYTKTYKSLGKILVSTTCMILVVLLLKKIIIIDFTSRLYSIIYIGIISVIVALVYLIVSVKIGLLRDVFKEGYVGRIKRKLIKR